MLFHKVKITQQDINEVTKVLKSGWITTGKKCEEFEQKINNYIGNDCQSKLVSSNTMGLQLVFKVLNIGKGDEVITSTYSYASNLNVIINSGAKAILIDIDKQLKPNIEQLINKITRKTKAVVLTDLGGVPLDYDYIRKEITKVSNHTYLIIDSAHSFGAEIEGDKVGTQGDFHIFSFHAVKNLTTAEGGCITWKKNPYIDYKKEFDLLSLNGQSKSAYQKQKGDIEYDIVDVGYKCNMTDIQAALGLSQLKRYENELKIRQNIVDFYNEKFNYLGIESNLKSSNHLYFYFIPKNIDKKLFIDKCKEKGLMLNVHYKPLHLMTAFKNNKQVKFNKKELSNSELVYSMIVSLPLYSLLTKKDLEKIVKIIKEVEKELNA